MPSSLDSHLVATAAIVGLLLLAGIALAIRLRGGRLRRRARELELQTETVVDARTRELRAELEALQQALEELKAAKAQIEATDGWWRRSIS